MAALFQAAAEMEGLTQIVQNEVQAAFCIHMLTFSFEISGAVQFRGADYKPHQECFECWCICRLREESGGFFGIKAASDSLWGTVDNKCSRDGF